MKNKIIISILSIALLGLNILLLYFFVDNKGSFFLTLGYFALGFIIFRILLFICQELLVKLNILKYVADDFSYYDKTEQEIRKKANIGSKKEADRVLAGAVYNIMFIILVALVVKFLNDEGIIASILVGLLLAIPSLLLTPRYSKWDGFGDFRGGRKEEAKPKRSKIRVSTTDYGFYSETTYRDENGNKIGKATSFDWGPVKDTTFTDKDGNETKIEHWKF